MEYSLFFCLLPLLAIAALYLLDRALLRWKGDCRISIDASRLRLTGKDLSPDSAAFSFSVPFVNPAPEQGILIDAYGRIEPEGNKYKGLDGRLQIRNREMGREDDYWEACLIKPRKELPIEVKIKFTRKEGPLPDLSVLSPVYVDLHYKYYGRNPIRSAREVLCLLLEGDPASETASGPGAGKLEESGASSPKAESNGRAIPVRTHILGPRDDLSEVIRKYAKPVAAPEDVVAVAESVVAITQGRFAYVEDIEPSFWARRLNRFFHYDSSLGSVYSMEMAIREVGLIRILTGVLVGTLGKLVGRKGDFYRITGRGAATIDDCTGTMPPYDKCVVLGPKDPGGTAAALKEKTGLAVAVVDANDLQKVDVLGASSGVSPEDLAEALRHNPQGNADEQTPLVVVKKKGI